MPAGTTNGQYAGRTMPSSTTGSMPGGYQPGTSTTSNGFNMNPAVNQQPSQGYPTSNNFGAGQNMGGAGVTGGSMPSVGQPGVVGASNGGVSGPAIPQRPPNTVIYNDTSFPSSPPLGGASGASSLGSGAPLPTPMPVR